MGTHKNRRAREAFAAINLLVETFPAAFVRINRKPLKLGIAEDMLARGVAPETIKVGLRSYCRGVGYLSAIKAGAARIDLDGNPAGVVHRRGRRIRSPKTRGGGREASGEDRPRQSSEGTGQGR